MAIRGARGGRSLRVGRRHQQEEPKAQRQEEPHRLSIGEGRVRGQYPPTRARGASFSSSPMMAEALSPEPVSTSTVRSPGRMAPLDNEPAEARRGDRGGRLDVEAPAARARASASTISASSTATMLPPVSRTARSTSAHARGLGRGDAFGHRRRDVRRHELLGARLERGVQRRAVRRLHAEDAAARARSRRGARSSAKPRSAAEHVAAVAERHHDVVGCAESRAAPTARTRASWCPREERLPVVARVEDLGALRAVPPPPRPGASP